MWGAAMSMSDHLSTGEIQAVFKERFTELDPGWAFSLLVEMNKSAKWLREKLCGNAKMCVPWSGGKPGKTTWETPVHPLGEPQRNRKRT